MFSDIKKLTRTTIIYGLGHILSRSIGFLLLPLHTNFLDDQTYGAASLLLACLAFMTIACGLWIDSAFMRYYIIARTSDQKQKIFSTAFWMIFLIALSCSILSFLLAVPLSDIIFTNTRYATALRLCSGIVFFDALTALFFLLLRADERSMFFVCQKCGNVMLNLILNYLLIIKLNHGIDGIFEANLISSATTFILILPIVLSRLKIEVDLAVLKKLVIFGIPFLFTTLAATAIDIMDRFILGFLTDLKTVGIYSVGYRLGLSMNLIVIAFRFAWVPFFLKRSQQAGAQQIFARVLTYFSIFIAMVYLSIIYFIDNLVRVEIFSFHIFGPEYWDSTAIVPIVLLAYWAYGLQLNFSVGIHLKEKTKKFILTTGIGAIINIVLGFLLIPIIGMAGAAWATVIAHLVMALMVYQISQRLYFIKYEFSRIIQILGVTVFLFFTNYFFQPTIPYKVLLLLSLPFLLLVIGFYKIQELNKIREAIYGIWNGKRT